MPLNGIPGVVASVALFCMNCAPIGCAVLVLVRDHCRSEEADCRYTDQTTRSCAKRSTACAGDQSFSGVTCTRSDCSSNVNLRLHEVITLREEELKVHGVEVLLLACQTTTYVILTRCIRVLLKRVPALHCGNNTIACRQA